LVSAFKNELTRFIAGFDAKMIFYRC